MTTFADLLNRSGMSCAEAASELGVSEETVRLYQRGEIAARPRDVNVLRGLLAAGPAPTREPKERLRFIDLFAGIGGMRLGFEELGRCVFTSEWDRFAQQTYRVNFPGDDHEIAGDIRAIDARDIPEHDILLAGFPCQPFSIAGVSKKNALGRPHGFGCDTQGTLFFDVQRIIAHHRPRAFLLENVKNLESHDGGRTFATIMNVLRNELGYQVQYRVISSEPWVPQKRQRIFIVGFREPNAFNFDSVRLPPSGRGPKLGSILQPPYQVDPKYTLTEHLWQYLRDYKARHSAAGNGFGFGLFGPDDVARTLSARYYKDGSEILIEQRGSRPRRLTPRECARLMGFDCPGRSFRIPVSDTQAYRQFGNAVVVPVVEFVARTIQPYLMNVQANSEPARLRVTLAAHG